MTNWRRARPRSPHSWSIDFAARREAALAPREPLDTKAAELREKMEEKQVELRARKKAGAAQAALEKLAAKVDELDREVRALDAKAQDIE